MVQNQNGSIDFLERIVLDVARIVSVAVLGSDERAHSEILWLLFEGEMDIHSF